MRIVVVSRSWPSHERSGVSLVAEQHVNILVESGYDVLIIGSNPSVLREQLSVTDRFYVPSTGSGALYSPAFVDVNKLTDVITKSCPDLIICEAWQTALTDAAVDVSYKIGIPVLMISHGVSLHSYSNRLIDVMREWAWVYYKYKKLPQRVSRLSAITTLDSTSSSDRFYDRGIAQRLHIPVVPLVNSPINWCESYLEYQSRRRQVLVVGYFSEVKNQLAAIDLFAAMPADLNLRFIGMKTGYYYSRCRDRVDRLGLRSRVSFLQDSECDVAEEIGRSLVVLCCSITEALPVTLLEAMASGTPFVASPIGAIPNMGSGMIARDKEEQIAMILSLVNDVEYWTCASQAGRRCYLERYTLDHVRRNLLDAISTVIKGK
jgi:glycosyltransferase involved in cell wall biosynthesis